MYCLFAVCESCITALNVIIIWGRQKDKGFLSLVAASANQVGYKCLNNECVQRGGHGNRGGFCSSVNLLHWTSTACLEWQKIPPSTTTFSTCGDISNREDFSWPGFYFFFSFQIGHPSQLLDWHIHLDKSLPGPLGVVGAWLHRAELALREEVPLQHAHEETANVLHRKLEQHKVTGDRRVFVWLCAVCLLAKCSTLMLLFCRRSWKIWRCTGKLLVRSTGTGRWMGCRFHLNSYMTWPNGRTTDDVGCFFLIPFVFLSV